ncbi:hypothetical protein MRB53_027083 [Persea americana]|uniref:Uncharacterized protein n=1 Tax=Persea americana TaxID=3435 RepID=A0ACC2LJW6_PERAE|nr:hypothetical protein MRB53_027083 [Persea americana]
MNGSKPREEENTFLREVEVPLQIEGERPSGKRSNSGLGEGGKGGKSAQTSSTSCTPTFPRTAASPTSSPAAQVTRPPPSLGYLPRRLS